MSQELENNDDEKLHSFFKNRYEPCNELGDMPTFILQRLDQYSNDLIVVWDEDLNLVYSSLSFRELLNYNRSEIHGDAWRSKVSIENYSFIDACFKEKTPIQLFNVNILNSVGENHAFEIKIERYFEKEKNQTYQTYLIGFCKHIPKTLNSEELMIRSEKMSIAGQLAAGIAHEIRNPLTSIKGFLQLLKSEVDDKNPYFHIMNEEIDKIEAITSELLFVSKPLTNKKEMTSLQSMVKDITILLNTQAKQKNISVYHDDQQDFLIYCDSSQVKQVLINIIKNAIEATEPTGKVKILIYKRENSVKIDVVDEGPGISKKDISKITEPFYTTKQGGTGLGLMITKQIIEKHDGSLKILRNKHKGSTFRIILPEH